MKLSEMTAEHMLNYSPGWLNVLTTEFLGRLSVKVEPAGKLRVFAIVDC